MHSPRFARANYIPHQSQWRPHGPRFGSMWPVQPNYLGNPRGQNNFLSNDYWCETCDRGFRTSELLINHKQQHQKCNIDGCQFIAHPKVITKHIQMQHSTGLYKKISKLDNPEEIQKWIEERKKRYPTKENIEKRNAERKEKFDRGEKMGMRTHRGNKHNQTEQSFKRKSSYDNNNKNFKKKFQGNQPLVKNKRLVPESRRPPVHQRDKKSIPQIDHSKTLKPFTGILNLLDDTTDDDVREDIDVQDSIEDDEYMIMEETNDNSTLSITEPVVCGALSSLINNYESSDEDSIHQHTETQEKLFHKTTQLLDNKDENLLTQNNDIDQNDRLKSNDSNKKRVTVLNNPENSDGDSGPEEAAIVKNIETEINTDPLRNLNKDSLKTTRRAISKERQINNINSRKNNTRLLKSKLPSTLLEKLLHKEIRHERNIVLQCIRYIVKNNYFQKNSQQE